MPSLSRLYRPKTFADITDQDPVKDTLRLEVETGKISHAYLFGGPRGVGKTTTARIFAKALNCENPNKGEPCNVCAACLSADSGSSLGVIEMDAASNNGVENVRENIIEHVRFAPSGSKYKVYILDEAHMITTAAWNALLKTLEEPPSYAVFILITTELHKVPATILSRCQRFDFKRIPDGPVADRLNKLCEIESVSIEPAVIKRIVSKSDGCLRDAESLLGQLFALGEKKITTDIADLVLPISRLPIAAELLSTFAKRQLGESLEAVGKLEENGISLLQVFDDLISAVRQLLLAIDSVAARHRLAEGDEAEKKLATLVSVYEAPELADMALMFMERRRDAKQGADERFCLELAATAVALQLLPNSPGKNQIPAPIITARASAPLSAPIPFTPPLAPSRSFPSNSIPPKPHVTPPSSNAAQISSIPGSASTVSGSAPIIAAPAIPTPAISNADIPQLTLSNIHAKWPTFMKAMDAKSPSLTFVLRISRPIEVQNNIVKIEFKYPYHKEKIVGEMKARRLVEDCMREVYSNPSLRIDGIVVAEGDEVKEARQEDTVNSLLRVFGGNIVEETGSSNG